MPEEKVKALYGAVSEKFDVGTLDEFELKLQDETKRKAFYDAASADFDLGDFNTFSEKVKKKDQISGNGSGQSASAALSTEKAAKFNAGVDLSGLKPQTPNSSDVIAPPALPAIPLDNKTSKEKKAIAKQEAAMIGASHPEKPKPEQVVDVELLKQINPGFKETQERKETEAKINDYILSHADEPSSLGDFEELKKKQARGFTQDEEYRILSDVNIKDVTDREIDDQILKKRLTQIEAEGSLGEHQGELVTIRDGIKKIQPDVEKQKANVETIKAKVDGVNQQVRPYMEVVEKEGPEIQRLNDLAYQQKASIDQLKKLELKTPAQIDEQNKLIDDYNKTVTELNGHTEFFAAAKKVDEIQKANAPLYESYEKATNTLNGTIEKLNGAIGQYGEIVNKLDQNGYAAQYQQTYDELEENANAYEKVAKEQNGLIKKYPEVFKKHLEGEVENLKYEIAKKQGGMAQYNQIMDEGLKVVYNFGLRGIASGMIAINENLGSLEGAVGLKSGQQEAFKITDALNKVVDQLIVNVPEKEFRDAKTGEKDYWRLLPQAAGQAMNIYMLVQGGGALGGGMKGLVTTAYLTQFESIRKEAVAGGLSREDAALYAIPVAAGQALLEAIMPDAHLVFGSKEMLASFIKNIAKDRNLAFKSITDQLKRVILENTEEFSQAIYGKMANMATNYMLDSKLDTKLTKNETINTVAITTPIAFFAGVGNIRTSHNRAQNYQVSQLALDPDKTAQAIKESLDAGILTPDEAQQVQEKVDKYVKIMKGMPPDLPLEQKLESAPIVEEIEDLEAGKKEMSPPFQKVEQEKIKHKEKEFLEIVAPEMVKEEGETKKTPAPKTEETKQPEVAAEEVPVPAPVNTTPTPDGKNETQGRKKRRQDVLTPEPETASKSEAVSPVQKTMDAAMKPGPEIHVVKRSGVSLEMESHKGGIRLANIQSKNKTKGNAAKLFNEAIAYADEKQIPLYATADAKPGEGNMSQEQIEAWYKRKGFQFKEGTKHITRLPKPVLTQEQKDTNNAEAEKLGWDNSLQALGSIAKRTGQYYTSWAQVPDEVKAKVSLERTAEKAEPVKETAKERNQKLIDKLEKLKSGKNNTYDAILGIPVAAWDFAIGTIQKSLALEATVEDAIKKGIEYLRSQKIDFDEKKFIDHLTETFGEEETPKGKTVPKKKKKKPAAEPEGSGKKKRRFTKQVMKSKDVPDVLKNAVTEDQIYYTQLPHSVTLAEANSIIDYLGEDEAVKAFTDQNNGITPATRFTMGSILIKRLGQLGENQKAIDVLELNTKRATEAGQGISALALFQFLTPEGFKMYAQRQINNQRESRAKKDRKKTGKIISGLKKANKEAIDEVLEKPEVKKQVEKTQKIEPKVSTTKNYGTENKVVTKARYTELLGKIRGKLFSNPLDPVVIEIAAYHLEASGRKFGDFTANMIRDFGSKVKPYLKEIYDSAKEKLKGEYSDFDSDASVGEAAAKMNTDHLVKAMEKAMAKGVKKEIDKALASLQQASKENGLWGKYRDMAVARLKNLTPKQIGDDINSTPALEEFTNGLIKNISQQVNEPEAGEKTKKTPKSPIEIIADAYKNFEKYADVWAETVLAIQEKYKDQPGKLEELDAYFGEILKTPFSDKLIESAVKTGMKDLGQDLKEIVKSHYTIQDHAKATLQSKLINQAGLDPKEAEELADAIEKEFDRIATKKKQDILNQMFSTKERKKPEIKTLESELIKLTNLGAFSDAAILEKYAEKMGYPKLTAENITKIEKLATAIQDAPDGIKKFRAIEDLLTYQQSIQGVSMWDTSLSLWYASILSGHQTQITNGVANAFNTGFLFANAALQNPKNSVFMAQGLWDGWMRGLSEGKEVLRTGYNPIRENKVEVPPVLEWKNFIGGKFNPANYAKYVRRLMVAVDTVFFEGLKEMRAYQLAAKMAAAEGRVEPTLNQRNRALEILNKTDDSRQRAFEQAEIEYKSDAQSIRDNADLSEKEKTEKLAQAERDKPRRVNEIMEKGRGTDLLKDTHTFAARGTYNFKPEGTLGYLSQMMNRLGEWVPPVKLIVPFTNIIANVANETMNYTPYGLARAGARGSVLDYVKSNRTPGEMTDQERTDTMVKAFMGTAMVTAFILLSRATGDDDEPMVEITANGYGDYRQNFDLKDWQPYSFRVKTGKRDEKTGKAIYGPWISYRLTPLVLGLSFAGNINDYEKYRKGKVTDKGFVTKMSIAAGQTVPTFLDMTFLSSASAFLKAISDVNSETVMDNFVKSTARTLKSFAIPNAYTQAAKEFQDFMDIKEKEVGATASGVDAVLEAMVGEFVRDLPVARDNYYNKVDGLGHEITPETSRIVTSRETTPEWNLLKEKKSTTNTPSIKTHTLWEGNTERFLNREEYYRFAKARGAIMEAELAKNMEVFTKMDQEDFDKEWSSIKSYATSVANEIVLDPKFQAVDRKPVKPYTEEQKNKSREKSRKKLRKRDSELPFK